MHPCTRHRSLGQSAIELALLLPFLLLLTAGIVDIAHAYQNYMLLTNATYAAARYGTLHPTDAAGVEARLRGSLAGTSLNITSVDVNAPGSLEPLVIHVEAEVPTVLGNILGMSNIPVSETIEVMVQ